MVYMLITKVCGWFPFRPGAFLGASGQHEVGHEGVITGRDAFSLRSPTRFAAGSRANRCFLRESVVLT